MVRTKKVPGILSLICLLDSDRLLSYRHDSPSGKSKKDKLIIRVGSVKSSEFDPFIAGLVALLNEYSETGDFSILVCCSSGDLPTKEQVIAALKLKNHTTTEIVFYGGCVCVSGCHLSCYTNNTGLIYSELSAKYNWTEEQRRVYHLQTYRQKVCAMLKFLSSVPCRELPTEVQRYICSFVVM